MRPWRCLPQGWLSRQGGLTPAPRPPPAAARVSGAGGSAIRPRSLSAASLAAPPAANAQPGPGAEIGQSPRPPPAPLGAVGGGGGAGPPSPISPGDPRVWGGGVSGLGEGGGCTRRVPSPRCGNGRAGGRLWSTAAQRDTKRTLSSVHIKLRVPMVVLGFLDIKEETDPPPCPKVCRHNRQTC